MLCPNAYYKSGGTLWLIILLQQLVVLVTHRMLLRATDHNYIHASATSNTSVPITAMTADTL